MVHVVAAVIILPKNKQIKKKLAIPIKKKEKEKPEAQTTTHRRVAVWAL